MGSGLGVGFTLAGVSHKKPRSSITRVRHDTFFGYKPLMAFIFINSKSCACADIGQAVAGIIPWKNK